MQFAAIRRAASAVGLATLLAVQPASTLYPEVPAQKSKCPTTFRSPQGDASVSVECFLDYDLSEGLPNGELHEFMVVRSTGLPDHWRPSDSTAASQSWETTIPLGAVPRIWPVGGDPLPAGLIGYALNGVPFFSSVAPLADLPTDAALQPDRCMGFVDPASGAYHYRTMPPCLFGGSDRAAYDQHSMVEGYAAAAVPGSGVPSPLIGYMLDGFPLYGPYDTDGQLHAGLDSCNGKMVNGSYAYFATTSFPYIMGCYGPGAVDDTAAGVLPSARSEVVLDVTECPAGMYQDLATSRCVVCPAGTFGREAGLTSAACSGLCPPGAWCPPGSSTPVAQKCAAGRYGSAAGLSTAACSGPCSAGYYCPEGSTSAEQVPCGGVQWFCPEGSGDRVLVTGGYYTITVDNEGNGVGGGGGAPGGKASGAAALPHGRGRILTGLQGHAAYESASGAAHRALPSGVADAAARDLNLLRRTKEAERHRGWLIISEPGTYSHRGLKRDCPAGRYGDVPGLKSAECTAACPPGHFCPKGSALPTACPKGAYGATEGLEDAGCSGQAALGHYTPTASTSATEVVCPAGRYGDSLGLTTDACSHDCDAASGFCEDSVCKEGYYCPPASVSETQVECGGSAFFCPKGSALPTPVATGYYTVGSLSKPGEYQTENDVKIRDDQVICEPGTYCIDGVRIACPAGRFGGESGLSHHTCSGPAEAGYYTPIESVSARQVDCGGTFNYCPEGSPEPVPVGVGNYSVDGCAANRAWTMTCEPGYYCDAGVKRMCPAGRYGKPHPTPPHGSLTHRAPYAYPTGTYIGLSSEKCSGPCKAGHYCPAGSTWHRGGQDTYTRRTSDKYTFAEVKDGGGGLPCPAGQWGGEGMTTDKCEGLCAAGYYCPEGSVSPTQTSCGAGTLYCPPGSGEPVNVTKGYYAYGGTVTTRQGQAECLAQTPPDGARLEDICPSTTIGEGGMVGPDRWYDDMYDPFEYTRSVNENGVEAQYGGGQSVPADPSQTEGSASMN